MEIELLKNRTLKLYPLNYAVAYHDPCNLGRNSGVYDDPGKIIIQIHSFI